METKNYHLVPAPDDPTICDNEPWPEIALAIFIIATAIAGAHLYSWMIVWHYLALGALAIASGVACLWKARQWLDSLSAAHYCYDTSGVTPDEVESFMRGEEPLRYDRTKYVDEQTHREKLRVLALRALQRIAEEPEGHEGDKYTVTVTLDEGTRVVFWMGNRPENRSLWKVYYRDGNQFQNDDEQIDILKEGEKAFLESVKQHRLGLSALKAAGTERPEALEEKIQSSALQPFVATASQRTAVQRATDRKIAQRIYYESVQDSRSASFRLLGNPGAL